MRTIFNFLGPLTNPAGATRQVIGVSDPAFLEVIARRARAARRAPALVVSSEDGLDELSTSRRRRASSRSTAARLRTLRGRAGGRRAARARAYEDVAGGTPDDNAETARRIFAGEPGPARDLAVLNAGAAIYVAGRADGLEAGVRAAEAAIDDGARRRGARRARRAHG